MSEPILDGLVALVLGKEWLGNAIGATVRVDPGRAEWLRSNGYEQAAPPPSAPVLPNSPAPSAPAMPLAPPKVKETPDV